MDASMHSTITWLFWYFFVCSPTQVSASVSRVFVVKHPYSVAKFQVSSSLSLMTMISPDFVSQRHISILRCSWLWNMLMFLETSLKKFSDWIALLYIFLLDLVSIWIISPIFTLLGFKANRVPVTGIVKVILVVNLIR